MAELPEYRKQRAIEPAPVVQGVREAYGAMSATSSMIGEIGTQVAQDAANQMATIKGQQEAERNPGKQLLPAFTESDKAFQKAFEQQAYNGAIYSANKMLQKQYAMVLEQPLSSNSLELFKKNAMQGLEGIMQNVPKSMQQKVKNELLNAYSGMNFQLEKELAHKNQQELIGNFTSQFKQDVRSISEQSKLGAFQNAKEVYARANESIKFAETNRLISKADAQDYREINDLTFKSGPYVYALHQNYKVGEKQALDYIRHFQEHPPAGLSVTQHELIRKNLIDENSHMALADKGSKQLNNLEFIRAIDNNSVSESDLPQWKNKVGDENFISGMHKMEQHQQKQRQQKELALHIATHPGSGNSIAPEDAKNAFKGILNLLQEGKEPGQQLTAQDYENAAKMVNNPDSGYRDQIERQALSKNPQQMAEAGAIISNHDADPKNHYLDGIKPEAIAIARSYERQSAANSDLPLQQLAEKVCGDVLNVKKADREARLANKRARMRRYSDPQDLRTFLAGKTGWNRKDIPSSFITDFQGAIDDESQLYTETNFDLAIDAALNTLTRKTNITNINGEPEIVDWPIEMFSNKPPKEIHKEIIVDLKKHIPILDKMFTNKQINFTLELVEENQPSTTALYYAPHMSSEDQTTRLRETGIRRVNKVTRAGKESGVIRIVSDATTGWPTMDGKSLSYMVEFVSDKTGRAMTIPYSENNPLDAMRYFPAPEMSDMTPEQLMELKNSIGKRNINIDTRAEIADLWNQAITSSPGDKLYYNPSLYAKKKKDNK